MERYGAVWAAIPCGRAWIVAATLVLALGGWTGAAFAGAYIFAGESNGVGIVTHPTGYTAAGGQLDLTVCIAPDSVHADEMAASILNVISVFNELQPTRENLDSGGGNNVPSNAVDFESVLLHEVGHCVGLAHVNLASESGLSGASRNYSKTTNGVDSSYDLGRGPDGVRGSADDERGDDVNLHWFNIAGNDPFNMILPVDSTTYSRDLADLPPGDSFAANGDRTVSTLLGVPGTEAVMQQGTFYDEAQRSLTHDDVATLRYAASGLDELAGTSDDAHLALSFSGLSSSCDIIVDFDDDATSFAQCNVGGAWVAFPTHARISSAHIYFNSGYNWFFNELSDPGCEGGEPLSAGGCEVPPVPTTAAWGRLLLALLVAALGAYGVSRTRSAVSRA